MSLGGFQFLPIGKGSPFFSGLLKMVVYLRGSRATLQGGGGGALRFSTGLLLACAVFGGKDRTALQEDIVRPGQR